MCLNPVTLYSGTPYEMQVPCGKCIECEGNRAKEFAFRACLEKKLNEKSCYLTLTYGRLVPLSYGYEETVLKSDLQKFLKRLRIRHKGVKMKYLGCGEYGEKKGRPHYHLILFGYDFSDDMYFWKKIDGYNYYRSPELEEIWTVGFSLISEVTFKDCKYVAKYCQKQLFNENRERESAGIRRELNSYFKSKNVKYYSKLFYTFQEFYSKEPPFMVISKGLGFGAFEYSWLATDKIYIEGFYQKLPRCFLDRLDRNGIDTSRLRQRRKNTANKNMKNPEEVKKHKKIVEYRLNKKMAKK